MQVIHEQWNNQGKVEQNNKPTKERNEEQNNKPTKERTNEQNNERYNEWKTNKITSKTTN